MTDKNISWLKRKGYLETKPLISGSHNSMRPTDQGYCFLLNSYPSISYPSYRSKVRNWGVRIFNIRKKRYCPAVTCKTAKVNSLTIMKSRAESCDVCFSRKEIIHWRINRPIRLRYKVMKLHLYLKTLLRTTIYPAWLACRYNRDSSMRDLTNCNVSTSNLRPTNELSKICACVIIYITISMIFRWTDDLQNLMVG